MGREEIQQAREKDKLRKDRMKEYRDAGRIVQPHNIQQGELILLRRKTTKHNSMYDRATADGLAGDRRRPQQEQRQEPASPACFHCPIKLSLLALSYQQ